jgi:hypothetical protein
MVDEKHDSKDNVSQALNSIIKKVAGHSDPAHQKLGATVQKIKDNFESGKFAPTEAFQKARDQLAAATRRFQADLNTAKRGATPATEDTIARALTVTDFEYQKNPKPVRKEQDHDAPLDLTLSTEKKFQDYKQQVTNTKNESRSAEPVEPRPGPTRG